MNLWQSVVLGIVQGLTEFLPISSTGHVTALGKWMGLIEAGRPEEWTAFLAVVQLGTLAAVLVYFANDILRIARGFLQTLARRESASAQDRRQARLGWFIIMATIPVVIAGLALKDVIEGDFTKDMRVIATALIGLAVLLWIAERTSKRQRDIANMRWTDAAIAGAAQVVSLVPGASRSGATITGGLLAGLTREAAARFSFLMSILAIGGSALYELPDALDSNTVPAKSLVVVVVMAAISGFIAIAVLLRFLQRHSTHIFIWYRIALGLLIFGLLLSGVMSP